MPTPSTGRTRISAMPPDTAALLDHIIRDLQRLAPSWQRPEVFHQFKSELIDKLRTMLCHPLVTRHVVRFVTAATAASPGGETAPTRERHRNPTPRHAVPGQAALGLETSP
jgi:hypothetical protein